MRKYAAIIFSLIAIFTGGQAQARTEAEVKKDLIKAARTAVTIYKKDGMAGLIEKTQSCYKNEKINEFYCVYFDLASRHIEQLMIDGAAQHKVFRSIKNFLKYSLSFNSENTPPLFI